MLGRFKDRTDGGRKLAAQLSYLRDENVIVLGLPRGGVPVAFEIARALHAPLDVLNVRKLGLPSQEELAMGAIATGGVRVLNKEIIAAVGVTPEVLNEVTAVQRSELDRRERLYRSGRPAPELRGRTVVLVDDGIATGATVRAAISVLRAQKPLRIILATPVAQASVAEELAREVDEFACVITPGDLYAIGAWYDNFQQLTDDQVRAILARAWAESPAERHDDSSKATGE